MSKKKERSEGNKGPETRPSRHTPGPWSIASHNGTDIGIISRKSGKGGQMVSLAIIDEDVAQDDDEHFANARLIAAAPDLLAACHHVLRGYEAWTGGSVKPILDALPSIRAAIAKAEGGAE